MPTVLYDTAALADARRQAGIGRYTAGLLAALAGQPGVRVVRTPPLGTPGSEARPWRWARAQPSVTRAFQHARADLYHATTGDAALGIPAARQVCTVHDAYLWTAPLPEGPRGTALRGFRAVIGHRLRGCGAVITTSEPTADDVVEALRLDRSRVHVIPLGVDPGFRHGVEAGDEGHLEPLAVRAGEYLLFTGNLRHHDPRKGLDVLLEAVHRLGADAPPLVLAGSAGAEAHRLQGVGRRLGVDVRLAGDSDDARLAALYRQAAVFVMPSRYEGFGLSVLEAMASGAPVVATSGGNLRSLTAGAASLVPVDDSEAMAEAIRSVLTDPHKRDRHRRDGLARAADYSWTACAAATVAVYQQLVSAR